MAASNSNLALLIDGDNVSPKIIIGLMAEIAKYGHRQRQANLWRLDESIPEELERMPFTPLDNAKFSNSRIPPGRTPLTAL